MELCATDALVLWRVQELMVEKDTAKYEALARLERLDSEAADLAQHMAANLSVRLAAAQRSAQELQAEERSLKVRESDSIKPSTLNPKIEHPKP